MKTYLAAAALSIALAPPASAITFPSLTTIYVGSGVRDDGGGMNTGVATTLHCSNVSGVSVSVRFLVLSNGGTVVASHTLSLDHGQALTASTHQTAAYFENITLSAGAALIVGTINIESTESGVFCNAKTINAAATFPEGVTLPLVRVNPHPGTVE